MGSYLTIVNDTQDTWHCRLGPDGVAVSVAQVVLSVIGVLSAVIAAGAGATAVLTASGVVAVSGVASSMTSAGFGATSGFAMLVTQGISDQLSIDGYETIAPQASFRWGLMHLSQLRQATCVTTRAINGSTVLTETLSMRSLLTGATENSTSTYHLQSFVQHTGTEKLYTVATTEANSPAQEAHEEQVEALDVAQTSNLATSS